ncbi:hypothetical protein EIO_3071 (plasmid) [Ketogulonicigenium vulgare Y25]|uniref:Uncharacterized protein n=1 Tax=Ketogulonicigenium vulgare (strain WSH-001) TaxID=759362 RepID=F9YBA9_KETVW|nr:hypothetical protein EIO_3071 [Ketogulonicigenium vulgare Y25]AEM42661.1 hypothetical protein KVU_PA0244 [Ketogulonicigenium vulgare WSH-001]ALJ82466.1 hypothetical protein KVH_14190 [Ketogulonicigenium vulgare]ANW35406.1 hypothetical protein KvSKV_14095 [Ketogulonicigenium vulgare]
MRRYRPRDKMAMIALDERGSRWRVASMIAPVDLSPPRV